MLTHYIKNYLSYLPGIVLALILYLLSDGINNVIGSELLGLKKSPISTVMVAIIIGIIMGNAFIPRPGFKIGLEFTQSYILKFGIICLGIRLSFDEFIKFGIIAIPLIITCIISVLVVIKLLIKKFKISSKMSYLIAIGTSVCGATAIVATAPVINAKKGEVAYAIANITLFGVFSMLIYDQQFNSPETLNIATVTKLIRNTFLVVMIPLFGYLYNRGNPDSNTVSIVKIFPYFVLGFIAMILIRNIGDEVIQVQGYDEKTWNIFISYTRDIAKICLTMAMAAVGMSTNLSELKEMGYKPFVVGLIAAITVGLVSILTMQSVEKITSLL
jgi:uncharacterized membrane protein YadS